MKPDVIPRRDTLELPTRNRTRDIRRKMQRCNLAGLAHLRCRCRHWSRSAMVMKPPTSSTFTRTTRVCLCREHTVLRTEQLLMECVSEQECLLVVFQATFTSLSSSSTDRIRMDTALRLIRKCNSPEIMTIPFTYGPYLDSPETKFQATMEQRQRSRVSVGVAHVSRSNESLQTSQTRVYLKSRYRHGMH